MRTFIAIPVPEEVKQTLGGVIQKLNPSGIDVTWSDKTKLHITLAFLGETAPAILPHLHSAMATLLANYQPFSCHAYGLGFFGNKRNPKVLWAGIDATPELMDFHEELWTLLKRFGYKDETIGDYRPHITLGRCPERAKNIQLIKAMDAEQDIDYGTWRAPVIVHYESKLTPRGPLYSPLNKFKLV